MPGEECAGEEVAGLLGVGGQVEDIEDIMGGDEVEPRERWHPHISWSSSHFELKGIKTKSCWCPGCEKRGGKLWRTRMR